MNYQLENYGWWQVDYAGTELNTYLLALAQSLGQPVCGRNKRDLIETLRPTIKDFAKPNSLSNRFSLSAFPFHCDTAHWATPCNYLILGCANPGKCGRRTVLLNVDKMVSSPRESELLESSVFLIKNGRQSFYGSIIQHNGLFVRFDPGCMTPTDEKSGQALELFQKKINEAEVAEVKWTKNRILIINNWRILHGRSMPLQPCSSRELRRVLVL